VTPHIAHSSALRSAARTALAALAASLLACSSGGPAPSGCTTAADCDLGQSCSNKVCGPLDAGTPQAIGGPCYESQQCESGLFCALDGTGLSGGVCTQGCSSGSCPTNTICADLRSSPVNAEVCLPTSSCRTGFSSCASLAGACLPAALCPASGISSAASTDLGEACTPGSCGAGETCRFGLDFPGGACTRACSSSDATSCPSNGVCAHTDQGLLCLPSCTTSASCRAGYSCAGTPMACIATTLQPRTCGANTLPLIIAGGTAGQPAAPPFCIEPIGASAMPSPLVQEFGQHPVGDTIQFQVPAGAASISIVSQALHARGTLDDQGQPLANTAVPTNITEPGGTVLYNDFNGPGAVLTAAPIYYATTAPGTGVLTFPNTTAGLALADAGLPAGTWSFQVNDYAVECANASGCDGGASTGVYDVSVLVKPGAAEASGTIDVAFYLVGAPGLTSANAAANSRIQRMLTTLQTLYAQAGICLGSVTFYDVPAWAQALYATGIDASKTGPCDDLNQMFTLARAGNTLNFFLVEAISSGGHGDVVGIDGTIPGPSTVGGTIHSGAAVSEADLNSGNCNGSGIDLSCGADEVAYIAAHEGGHWLGLYHTTEAEGDYFDPLTDTGTCTCALCTTGAAQANCAEYADGGMNNTSSPTFLGPSDCESASNNACTGGDNLMFWELDNAVSKGKLSAQQGEVMRSNLVVQ